jgi:hypothetical protein
MLERTESRFGVRPDYLAADSAYGSADNLAWLVNEKEIAPHIPVFDKSKRTDGTFSRSDFTWEAEKGQYLCPAGKELKQFHRTYDPPRSGITAEGTRLYRASKKDCDQCELKPRCCPNMPMRKIPRDLNEDARDVARAIAKTPEYEQSRHRRKKVEMLFAHLKRILQMARLRLRGAVWCERRIPSCRNGAEPEEAGKAQASDAAMRYRYRLRRHKLITCAEARGRTRSCAAPRTTKRANGKTNRSSFQRYPPEADVGKVTNLFSSRGQTGRRRL